MLLRDFEHGTDDKLAFKHGQRRIGKFECAFARGRKYRLFKCYAVGSIDGDLRGNKIIFQRPIGIDVPTVFNPRNHGHAQFAAAISSIQRG